MNYFKNLLPVLLTSIIAAVVAAIIGYWVFEVNWPFLPVPILAGVMMTWIQQANRSYKFIDKLLIGSIVFGFLSMFLICLRMYLILHPLEPTMPLIFNTQDYFWISLVFSFTSFLGGLLGIVIKGFWKLKQNK